MASIVPLRESDRVLHLWTIYYRPSDRPRSIYIARRSEVRRMPVSGIIVTRDIREASTLDGVRAMLPPGLIRLPRDPADDPVIVEVWV